MYECSAAASTRMVVLLLSIAASAASDALTAPWTISSVQDLHREYPNIFKHGNRNAASHLWSTFIFDRAAGLSPADFELAFSGFCAVSGSPVRPSDYTRYRLRLPLVGGGTHSGFLYYCCWPCVCDTQDFIRIDTKNVTLADGTSRRYHFAVVGNPCDNPAALHEPFVQPFHSRGPTTLAQEAAEVRCDAGQLIGATLSDGGYPIISMFFDAGEEQAPTDTAVAPAAGQPKPGRVSHTSDGVAFQDESEYEQMCTQRAASGYNSGMGEIFRKVAAISPVQISPRQLEAAPAAAQDNASGADAGEVGACDAMPDAA